MYDFKNKFVLITGATGSLGHLLCYSFAASGARIGVHGKDEKKVAKIVTELNQAGFSATTCVADLRDTKQISAMFTDLKQVGGVDILINNAASRPCQKFSEISSYEFDNVHSINSRGTFFVSQLAINQMQEKGGGALVHISSIVAVKALPRFVGAHYASI